MIDPNTEDKSWNLSLVSDQMVPGSPRTTLPEFKKEDKWDRRFMDLAQLVATWSKDPSSKMGAVLVRPDRTIASVGYNGFPRGMDDSQVETMSREERYARTVHCEMNAVLACKDHDLSQMALYTTGPSCDRCLVHMLQAGIRNFHWLRVDEERMKRWNVARSIEVLGMFSEVKIRVIWMDPKP